MSIKYDKLKNVESVEDHFDWQCPHCECDGLRKGNFDVKPVGVSFKPDELINDDIMNPIFRRGFDKLPTLKQALKMANNYIERGFNAPDGQHSRVGFTIKCNKCNDYIYNYKNIRNADLNKWISRNLKFFMRL